MVKRGLRRLFSFGRCVGSKYTRDVVRTPLRFPVAAFFFFCQTRIFVQERSSHEQSAIFFQSQPSRKMSGHCPWTVPGLSHRQQKAPYSILKFDDRLLLLVFDTRMQSDCHTQSEVPGLVPYSLWGRTVMWSSRVHAVYVQRYTLEKNRSRGMLTNVEKKRKGRGGKRVRGQAVQKITRRGIQLRGDKKAKMKRKGKKGK